MYRNLFLILFLAFNFNVMSQEIYLEAGKNYSSFSYRNSDGNSLDNLYGSTHFFLELGYHSASPVRRLGLSAGISYNGYGASGSDPVPDDYYDWNVNYLGLPLCADYELIRKRFTYNSLTQLSLYLKTAIAPEILIYGNQTINGQVYNLVGAEQFKYPMVFLRGGGGIRYSVVRGMNLYLQYLGGRGFPVKLGDKEDREKLRINAHGFSFGLLINLPSY